MKKNNTNLEAYLENNLEKLLKKVNFHKEQSKAYSKKIDRLESQYGYFKSYIRNHYNDGITNTNLKSPYWWAEPDSTALMQNEIHKKLNEIYYRFKEYTKSEADYLQKGLEDWFKPFSYTKGKEKIETTYKIIGFIEKIERRILEKKEWKELEELFSIIDKRKHELSNIKMRIKEEYKNKSFLQKLRCLFN